MGVCHRSVLSLSLTLLNQLILWHWNTSQWKLCVESEVTVEFLKILKRKMKHPLNFCIFFFSWNDLVVYVSILWALYKIQTKKEEVKSSFSLIFIKWQKGNGGGDLSNMFIH
jgi:hypothetical protein